MKEDLTKEEQNAISSLRRLAKRWPDSLLLYVLDGDAVYICKRGVPSSEFCVSAPLPIGPGAVITDLHDDSDRGRE